MNKNQKQILQILEQTYQGIGSALNFNNNFELLIAVILSAQTNDNQVNKVTEQLFKHYPNPQSLAEASLEHVEQLISFLGLYKNKAKNIIATSRILMEQFDGRVPADKAALISLPGVGVKTANVVLSVGFNIPALAVDTHVFRVGNRLNLCKAKDVKEAEAQLCALIPKKNWALAHHWLIWHGRKICKAPKPLCNDCPVAAFCPSCQLI